MLSSDSSSSSTCKTPASPRNEGVCSENVEDVSKTRVAFKPDAPLQQPLAPLDLSPFNFRHYMSWAVFFNYEIDFQRLVDALHIVAQKYLLLSGRLSTDSQGRYFIDVSVSLLKHSVKSSLKVGSTKEKNYDFPVVEMKADMQMAEPILHHGKITTNSADFPVHPDQLPFYLEPLNFEAIHKYVNLSSC